MGILLMISDLLIPVTVLCIVVFGCLQRMDIYEVFLEGAKEGLQTVLDILPTLISRSRLARIVIHFFIVFPLSKKNRPKRRFQPLFSVSFVFQNDKNKCFLCKYMLRLYPIQPQKTSRTSATAAKMPTRFARRAQGSVYLVFRIPTERKYRLIV